MGTASITENDDTPESFSLFQNYPNPFNPSTVIPFSINEAGFVELSLFNMLGQKVRTLINGYCTAGKQSVIWNGLDDEGKNAGSGIYIYRLKQGNFAETRKLLLLDGGYTGSGNGLPVISSSETKSTIHDGTVNNTGDFAKPATGNSYRVVISGDSVFPYTQSGLTVNDNDVLDFEISVYHEGAIKTLSPSESATIELTHDSMTFSMKIPEQAFSNDVVFTVKSTDELPPAFVVPDLRVTGKIWSADAEYTAEDNASSTGKLLLPSVLTIPYDPAVLNDGEDETDIFAAYLDGTVWIKANGILNADSDRITLDTKRLTLWTVFYGSLFEDITVYQAYEIIEENANNDNFVILDVRTPDEFAGGYIPGAINIDYRSESFESDILQLDMSKTYLVYCLSGGRSGSAVSKMEELGFRTAYNMLGGIKTWIFEEYPLEEQ